MLHALHITVVEGRDLKKTDLASKSDPFVVVQVGSATQRTSVRKNDQNPHWGERFTFDVTNEAMVLVEVRDEDRTGSDLIGVGLLPISEPLLHELRRGGAKVTVPLQDKKKTNGAGTVHLIVQGEFVEATPRPEGSPMHTPLSHPRPSPAHTQHPYAYTPRTDYGRPPVPADYDREAEALREQVRRLEVEIAAIKRRNETLERDQEAAVRPLREELDSNKKLLVQAVQCIEELADQQRKLEAAVHSPATERSPWRRDRVGETPLLRHNPRVPLAHRRTPSEPPDRHFPPSPARRLSLEDHPPHPWRSPYGSGRGDRGSYMRDPLPPHRAPYGSNPDGYRTYSQNYGCYWDNANPSPSRYEPRRYTQPTISPAALYQPAAPSYTTAPGYPSTSSYASIAPAYSVTAPPAASYTVNPAYTPGFPAASSYSAASSSVDLRPSFAGGFTTTYDPGTGIPAGSYIPGTFTSQLYANGAFGSSAAYPAQ